MKKSLIGIIYSILELLNTWINKLKSSKVMIALLMIWIYSELLRSLLPILRESPACATIALLVTGTLVTGVIGYFFKLRKDEKSAITNLLNRKDENDYEVEENFQ